MMQLVRLGDNIMRKRCQRIVMLFAVMFLFPNQSFANPEPSFDCSQVTALADKIICQSENLTKLDLQLSNVYQNAIAVAVEKSTLKDAQEDWSKLRRNCQSADCIIAAYEARISDILEDKRIWTGAAGFQTLGTHIVSYEIGPKGTLSLRTEPSVSTGDIIRRLQRGTVITLVSGTLEGWARIHVLETGQEGWVFAGTDRIRYIVDNPLFKRTDSLIAKESAEADTMYIQTPSGNIFCVYAESSANSPSKIDCEIGKFNPSFDESFARNTSDPFTVTDNTICTPPNLRRFTVEGGAGLVNAFCPSLDIVGEPLTRQEILILRYGDSFAKGGLICDSSKDGLSCRNESGNGFFLSKAKQSIFVDKSQTSLGQSQTSATPCGENSLGSCNWAQVCEEATTTTNGRKTWKNSLGEPWVSEASIRNLDCGVTVDAAADAEATQLDSVETEDLAVRNGSSGELSAEQVFDETGLVDLRNKGTTVGSCYYLAVALPNATFNIKKQLVRDAYKSSDAELGAALGKANKLAGELDSYGSIGNTYADDWGNNHVLMMPENEKGDFSVAIKDTQIRVNMVMEAEPEKIMKAFEYCRAILR